MTGPVKARGNDRERESLIKLSAHISMCISLSLSSLYPLFRIPTADYTKVFLPSNFGLTPLAHPIILWEEACSVL